MKQGPVRCGQGIHLFYTEKKGEVPEYWLYFNKNNGENLYVNTKIKGVLNNGVLRIFIVDENAIDESQLRNITIARFKINKKPDKVEVYYNGIQHNYNENRE